jgi:hypothetical protein
MKEPDTMWIEEPSTLRKSLLIASLCIGQKDDISALTNVNNLSFTRKNESN